MTHHGTASLWLAGAQRRPGLALGHDLEVDVAVIGGGIAGVTTAVLLARDGARVAILERGVVAGGATGYTTAKVSALQGLKYRRIRELHGDAGATAYAQASLAALDRIAAFVAEGIDCGWERLPAFTYAADDAQIAGVRDEANAAAAAGLHVELTNDVPLPFAVPLALRLDDQAQFDPVRYVHGLLERFASAGGLLFESTAVVGVHEGSPCSVETETGSTVRAADVVVCTNYPLLDRGLFFARTEAARSYLVAARVAAAGPRAMLISAGEPTRSMRSYTDRDGGHWMLIGGEGHTTGADSARAQRYEVLEDFARAHFEVGEIPYRWSTQDAMPVDGLPYIGRYTPLSHHLYVNAGGQKWGMTNATVGAMLLSDRLAGRAHAGAAVFDRAALPSVRCRRSPRSRRGSGRGSSVTGSARRAPRRSSRSRRAKRGRCATVLG